jgi:hypothetical protein
MASFIGFAPGLRKYVITCVKKKLSMHVLFLGPLTTLVNGKVTVVGIVSFGRTTCTPLVANGYERVTFQKDWILNNTDAGNWQCGTG